MIFWRNLKAEQGQVQVDWSPVRLYPRGYKDIGLTEPAIPLMDTYNDINAADNHLRPIKTRIWKACVVIMWRQMFRLKYTNNALWNQHSHQIERFKIAGLLRTKQPFRFLYLLTRYTDASVTSHAATPQRTHFKRATWTLKKHTCSAQNDFALSVGKRIYGYLLVKRCIVIKFVHKVRACL